MLSLFFRNLAPWYGDDPVSYCNRISGTDGQTVPAGTTTDDILDIFVSDLTMTIWMTHGASDTYRIRVCKKLLQLRAFFLHLEKVENRAKKGHCQKTGL